MFIDQGIDSTGPLYYASLALSYLMAMLSSNMSLQFVNYPTQVIGKSCKPIPVMIFASLFGKKVYKWSKYISVLIIVIGIIIFMYRDGHNYKTISKQTSYLDFGESLLILSLIMDGVTASIQEKIKFKFRTKSLHLMYNLNIWSVLYLTLQS